MLIHGASGGVGSILVQLARARGIDVVATASARNQGYLIERGATAVTYGPGLVERLEAAHPALFDALIDMAGGQEATEASLACVRPDGVIGSITGLAPSSPRVCALWVKRNRANLRHVVDGVADGRIRWNVSTAFPFAKAADAYAAILEGHTRGKSVLTF